MTRVEDVTKAPEMLGGRVKTLHPAIHAGILARLELEEDRATLAEHGIEPFDLVCVNLYPFTSLTGRIDVEEADIIEMIDVGGPSMLRGAAKNFAHVAPVCRPEQYDPVRRRAPRGARSRPRRAGRSPPRRSRSRPPTTRRSRAGSPRTCTSPTS